MSSGVSGAGGADGKGPAGAGASSGASPAGAAAGADRATDARDRGDVTAAADAVDREAVAREAATVAGVDPDRGLGRDGFELAEATEPGVGVSAVAGASPVAGASATADVAAAGAVAPATSAAPPENPAAFLADPSLDRAALDARLGAMETPAVTGLLDAIDTPELGFGDRLTADGRAALSADLDRRFTEASRAGDFANPELAELSREAFRHRVEPYSGRSWRELASVELARDPRPEAADTRAVLAETRNLVSHHVGGGMPPHEMTNGQLLAAVRDNPRMQLVGDIMGLTGVGLIGSFMAEGKARERVQELELRMSDGRLPPMDVAALTDNPAARAIGAGVLAAEVITTVTPQGLLRDGLRGALRWGARRIDDVVGAAAPRALRYAPGAAADAFTDTRRIQHASRHLIEDGTLGAWNNQTRRAFVDRATQILEQPQHTVAGWRLGPHSTDIYVGDFNGRTVGIAVFRDGPHAGRVATAFSPDATQRALWGLD
jgi:hypothetical protein